MPALDPYRTKAFDHVDPIFGGIDTRMTNILPEDRVTAVPSTAVGSYGDARASQRRAAIEGVAFGPIDRANEQLRQQNLLEQLRFDTLGKSASQIAEATTRQTLWNQILGETYGRTDQLAGVMGRLNIEIDKNAKGEATLADIREKNSRVTGAASSVHDATQSSFSTILSGIRNNDSTSAIFQSVTKGLEDRAFDMVSKGLSNQLLGKDGTGGLLGGGLKDLFGGASGSGGILSLFGFADGGPVYGPGGPRSDSIPARLSAGEYVIHAQAAAQHRALLDTINYGGSRYASSFGRGYADGGPVMPDTAAMRAQQSANSNTAAGSAAAPPAPEVHIHEAPGTQAQVQTTKGPGGQTMIIAQIKNSLIADLHGNGQLAQAHQQIYGLNRAAGRR